MTQSTCILSLTHDEKSNLFGNTITFPHNFAIRGAVRKHVMDFCLKKNFRLLFVQLHIAPYSSPRFLVANFALFILSLLSAFISPKRKLMNVSFEKMKYTSH